MVFTTLLIVGIAFIVVFVAAVWMILERRGAGLSFGPDDAQLEGLTTAPGVTVEILPSSRPLGLARFNAFDVTPGGAVLVSTGSTIVDMTSGDTILGEGAPIDSFAFVGGALAVVTFDGDVGFCERGTLRIAGRAPVGHPHVAPTSDRTRLLFYGGGDEDVPALAVMAAGASPQVLTAAPLQVAAAGGDEFQTYFSQGNALFLILGPGRPTLVLQLPDANQPIVGIALAGQAVYLSTSQAVYAFQDGLVAPLVLGLGGDLKVANGAIYVLDAGRQRVYRLSVGGEASP